MGKKHIQKKIGGPKGVEAYVKKHQKDLDAKVKNAPTIVQKTWESLKKIVAAGGKKCLEFCKKHWKAIVIVLCIIIAIALLIKYFGGQGTETVANSEIAQNSLNEINNGASEISGDSIDADDTNIDADDAEAQREMDELEQQGKEAGIDTSDKAMSKTMSLSSMKSAMTNSNDEFLQKVANSQLKGDEGEKFYGLISSKPGKLWIKKLLDSGKSPEELSNILKAPLNGTKNVVLGRQYKRMVDLAIKAA